MDPVSAEQFLLDQVPLSQRALFAPALKTAYSYCVISVRVDLVERCWCRAAGSKGSGVDGEPRRS
jgi:hypothetical protein